MFFPDEQVVVKFQVDNSLNRKDIKFIQCTLKYEIKIKKGI